MDLDQLPLGKKTTYPNKYDPSLLVGISRKESRTRTGISGEANLFFGLDAWTAYELSWLDVEGIPKNGVLYASYKSSSERFIESKSLKLYLNSINNKKFDTPKDLLTLIKNDLEQCISDDVDIEIRNSPKKFIQEGQSSDLLKSLAENVNEDEPWVNASRISEELSCDVFRSLCPVTGQPDWATIRINYSGRQINRRKLLKYLLNFRNMQAFHEECVEKIFIDVKRLCQPEDLTISAHYLRRGGIELNPLRSSKKEFNKVMFREIKQ